LIGCGYRPETKAKLIAVGLLESAALRAALIESAQHRRRAVNSAHLVALVRAGAKFENRVLVDRPAESTSGDTHAE
jgi:hypothetical protein